LKYSADIAEMRFCLSWLAGIQRMRLLDNSRSARDTKYKTHHNTRRGGHLMNVSRPQRQPPISLLVVVILLLTSGISEAATRIVALGASDTRGKGVALSQAYPAQLEARLRAGGYDARVINAGVNGDTTGGMLARLNSVVSAGTTLVILQPGGNDARRNIAPEQTAANLDAILSRLHTRGIKVLMFNYAGPVDNAGIAARNGATALGGFHVGVSSALHLADGHMTADGYKAVVDKIYSAVVAAAGR
jgi:acyl-CoA thioesterase I